MKKKIVTLILGICVAATVVGCGKISNDKITIEKYKGIEVQKVETPKVTDEDVEKSIQSTLEAKATEITDRAVKSGDITTMDYVGKVDGKEFDGGSATGASLRIGSGDFIDGFEDGMLGHTIGETFDLNLKFPENYYEELAGKDVVFTVTLKGIKGVPELTDELVKEVSKKSKTVDEFKKEVRTDLEASNKKTAESRLQQNIWQTLIDNCKVEKYPEDKKKELTENINTQYGQMAAMYGLEDAEAFVKQAFGITIEEMVENTIKQEFAVELIAKTEEIAVSDKEYKTGVKNFAEQYGYEDVAEFEKTIGKDNLKKVLLQEEVTEWLVDNCKQVDKKEKSK